MSLNGAMPEVFDTDVISVADFINRIAKIKEFCDNNKRLQWNFFYRGDRYCARTQSNFFRNGNIDDEAKNFADCLNFHDETRDLCLDNLEKFLRLAYMQHYQGNTRLLDFTKDPKVALRFACGQDGDDCRKKVTLYNTSYIKSDDPKPKKILDTFMSLIESDKKIPELHESQLEYLKKDYFVEVPPNFPRIKRQKGLFLLMGNFTTVELINGEPKDHKEKVKHELSPTVGRGDEYEGYVGVLSVSPHSVAQIRNELEQTPSYRMDYLMAEDENVNFNL